MSNRKQNSDRKQNSFREQKYRQKLMRKFRGPLDTLPTSLVIIPETAITQEATTSTSITTSRLPTIPRNPTPHIRVNTLSREKCSECLRHPLRTLVKLFLKLGTAGLIEPAENCPKRLLIQKRFRLWMKVSKHASPVAPKTSTWHSNWESYQVVIVPFQSFTDSSYSGTVDRNVQCLQNPCILLNLPLRLAAVSCTLR